MSEARCGVGRLLLDAAAKVAAAHGVEVADILDATGGDGRQRWRRPQLRRARHETLYLVVTLFGVPRQQVARSVGQTRSAVSKACRRVEEDRDDVRIDGRLSTLEAELAA